jgi:hypothetical protein
MTNIGIRTRGNTSDGNWKRQFKLSFDCTDPFTNAAPDAHLSFPEYDSRRFRGTKKLNCAPARTSDHHPEKIAAYVMNRPGPSSRGSVLPGSTSTTSTGDSTWSWNRSTRPSSMPT